MRAVAARRTRRHARTVPVALWVHHPLTTLRSLPPSLLSRGAAGLTEGFDWLVQCISAGLGNAAAPAAAAKPAAAAAPAAAPTPAK